MQKNSDLDPIHANSEKLENWLSVNIDGYQGPLSIEKFAGGQSNPTYKLTTPNAAYVLRAKPPGKLLKGAHAIEREYKIIDALGRANFPVAPAFKLCEDETITGTAFYIMGMVEGRVFWDASLPDIAAADRPAYYDAMNTTIASLHGLKANEIGLGDYGRPENYIQRQITRWSRQYQEDELAGRLDDMDMLVEWLPKNIPASDETSIVHGDFRCDNMIWHPTKPEVLAVLDWELSTLGHPLADFAYHLLMYKLPPHIVGGIAGHDLVAKNLPPMDEYVQAYCERTGRDKIDNLNFYLAFNLFRFGAIVHGIKGRMARGNASSSNAQALVATLPELAEIARATAENR